MNEASTDRAARVAELRRAWLGHAAAAFDLMFHDDHQADLITFDQREQRACESVDDLKAWLLAQHLAADADADPAAEQPVCCPRCGKHAIRLQRPDKPLEERTVLSLGGEVKLKRTKWRCATCRVAFFPSGSQAETGR